MALVVINGFCGDNCMDSYMASLLVCLEREFEIGVPATANSQIFERPPWELEDFFRMDFITDDKDRAWIFQHDNFPLVLKMMYNGFKWTFNKYQSFRIHGVLVFIQYLKFTYRTHTKHNDDSRCLCDHELNAEDAPGWKMARYKLGDHALCILTFKARKSFSKPNVKRKDSTRKGFETGDEHDQPKKKMKNTDNSIPLIDAGPSGYSTSLTGCLTGEAGKKLEEGQTTTTFEDLNSSAKVSSDYLSHDEELKLKQLKNSDTPSLSVEGMREAQAHLKTPYFVLSGNVKPGYYDFLPPNQATPNGFKSQWVEPKSGIKVPYSSNTIWGSAENLGLMDAGPSGSSTSLSGDSQGVLTLNSASSSPPVLAQISPSRVADPRAGPGLAYKSYQRVHVPQGLMGEFLSLAESNTTNNLETCGLLGGSMENGVYHVTALIIPKQESTSYSCETKNEGEILAVQQKHSLTILGWIHTHPTQACFMSSVDLHTQYSYQILLREAIGIVMAPTDESRTQGIFHLSDPLGVNVIRNCRLGGFHSHLESEGNPIYEDCSHVVLDPKLKYEVVDLRL